MRRLEGEGRERGGGERWGGAESCLFIRSYRTRKKKSWLRYAMI